MKKKKFSLIEGLISIMLFAFILGILRYIVFDSSIYAKSIKYNNSQIAHIQNAFILFDEDLNYTYKINISKNQIIAQTSLDEIIYTKKNGGLYRNNVKLLDLSNIDIYFYDATSEINNGNGTTIVKLDIFYKKKNKLEENTVNFTKYINTQEKL
ncbi:type IV pilus modification PilV family protein [Alkaliphilus sp. B6464]|uniref:type IV pilus modification PilV family protein n=1 Tax=Alkaliphilus sp. B6464 TaxID=2731219 RepID=UPI001BAE1DE7|nr:hypothetical protein [Alkaliphilus sp. B6464]QUH22134.1 hypothetical protein HYG84_19700 [Alkaliphilus sp. B6464]